jgi:predicted lactoylglutathione lyase
VDQRVSLITLGVADLARSRAFYEAMGWHTNAGPEDDVVFFQAGGMIVGLWGRDQLAQDSGVVDSGGWGGVTIALNVPSPEAVDTVLAEAGRAGATIARPGAATFWGGYSGLFIDPDGHPWEVAHNPHWTLAPDGSVRLAP